MKLKNKIFMTTVILTAFTSIALADCYVCEFVSESLEMKDSKINKVTCSGTPEKVFSAKESQHPRNKHCKKEDYGPFEDQIDTFIITDEIGAFVMSMEGPRQNPEELKYHPNKSYIKIGRIPIKTLYETIVANSLKVVDRKYGSDIIENISELKTFKGNGAAYSLWTAQRGDSAIFTRYWTGFGSTWVTNRFGKCYKISTEEAGKRISQLYTEQVKYEQEMDVWRKRVKKNK